MTMPLFSRRETNIDPFGELIYYYSWLNMKVELAGIGGYGAALYCGTGCFHWRESHCGKVYSKDYKGELNLEAKKNNDKTINEMEELSKAIANCSAEKDTQWGKNVSRSLSHTHTLTFVRRNFNENGNYICRWSWFMGAQLKTL